MNSLAFRTRRPLIRSSTVPAADSMRATTPSFWPMRCTRQAACALSIGVQLLSTKTTSLHLHLGPTRVIAVPAAWMLPMNTRQLGSFRNLSTASSRSAGVVVPVDHGWASIRRGDGTGDAMTWAWCANTRTLRSGGRLSSMSTMYSVAPRSFAAPSIRRIDISRRCGPAMPQGLGHVVEAAVAPLLAKISLMTFSSMRDVVRGDHGCGSSGTGTVSQRIGGRSLKTSSLRTRIMKGAIRVLSLSRFFEPSMTRISRPAAEVLVGDLAELFLVLVAGHLDALAASRSTAGYRGPRRGSHGGAAEGR